MNIEKKLRDFKPNIKDSTIKNYMVNLKKICCSATGKDTEPIDLLFLKSDDKLDEYIKNKSASNTRKNLYNIIVVFLTLLEKQQPDVKKVKSLIEKYTELRNDLNKKYSDDAKTNQKSERQEANWMTTDEIDKVANSFKESDFQLYAIIKFHLLIPLRNDLASVIFTNKRQYNKATDKPNAIIKIGSNYQLRLNDYKTNKAYGEKVIDVPPELNPIIRRLLKLNKGTGYLIYNKKKDKSYSSNDYTRLFNSAFKKTGKKISTTMMRTIILSEKFGDLVKDQKQMASQMCHSKSVQNNYIKTSD